MRDYLVRQKIAGFERSWEDKCREDLTGMFCGLVPQEIKYGYEQMISDRGGLIKDLIQPAIFIA